MTDKELKQKVKRLEDEIDWLKTKIVDLQEEKGLAPVKTSYEVEVPEDLEEYYMLEEGGDILKANTYSEKWRRKTFIRGLVFETREQAERYDKKRILINKMEDWAKKHNGDWTPDWNDDDETIYEVQIDRFPMYGCDSPLVINEVEEVRSVSIFPYFYSHETAREFIDEFRGEIEEVFC